MKAAQYDITLDRAAEYRFTLTIKNRLGALVNLTGNSFYADIIDAATRQQVASFTATVTNPATSGEVVLSLSEADSLLFNVRRGYEWDLFRVSGTSTERLLYGKVIVRQNRTKGVPIDPIS